MNRKRMVVMGVVLAAVGVAVWAGVFRRAERLEGSGTIEAKNIRVGSKVGGRIEQVLVEEGHRVEAGQVLVTFDERELRAALDQARANYEKLKRGYRAEEIAWARAAAAQAKAEYEERARGYRQEQVAAAKAALEQAQADAWRADVSWERARQLADGGVWSKSQRDEAEAAWKAAQAAEKNTEERYRELERGYRSEQVASAEAKWRQAEAELKLRVEGYRREDVEATRAALADAEAKYRERQVTSPAAATVEVLDVRPGDLVAPNAPIATLLERGQLYVRVYVPETKIGRVQVGQKVEVRTDSLAGEVFAGEVEQINQKAEFLPRNVQTKEERVHQMFGVKVRIRDASGRLKAGMAAEVKWEGRW